MQEQVKDIPQEIQKFNWGAMLFNWLWGIRHGVWISLLSFVPIIGWIFMPIILGFKGNEWAWKKNNYTSTKEFLKRQRKWAIAAVLFYVTICSTLFYSLNYSDAVMITLSTLNKNEKALAYLGKDIHKDTYFGSIAHSIKNDVTTIETGFRVRGSKQAGDAKVKLRKFQDQIIIDELIISGDGEIIIDKPD